MRAVAIVMACGAVVGAAGCAKRQPETNPATGHVSVQRPTGGPARSGDWASAVFPARYADPVLPKFPPEAIIAQVAHATVRVDFDVRVDGRAHNARFELAEPVPEGSHFVAACREALERWQFSPAWRLAREADPGGDALVLVPSKARLVFRFDLEAHLEGADVELSFGPGNR